MKWARFGSLPSTSAATVACGRSPPRPIHCPNQATSLEPQMTYMIQYLFRTDPDQRPLYDMITEV